MRKVVKREVSSESGDRRGSRFHHRRGHFKTYTDEAPLFGRWTGSWWWSDQVQGNLELGMVDKQYQVDRPAGGRAPGYKDHPTMEEE